MTWTLTLWAILVGGPLLGITAVCALAVLHEHGGERVRSERVGTRRSSTVLLEDYLLDAQTASLADRHRLQDRLILQTARASTVVLEDFLEDRVSPLALRAPIRRPAAPALGIAQPGTALAPAFASKVSPASSRVLSRPAPRALQPRPTSFALERGARPTRLVPLSPEIAIG
jgi:hypothetical protein